MASNIDKYKEDLEKLIEQGRQLMLSMYAEFHPETLRRDLKNIGKDEKQITEYIKKLPSFTDEYQGWYSEALVLIKQLLPDRVTDFTEMYGKPEKERKTITSANYVIKDALDGLILTEGKHTIADRKDAIPLFRQQFNILKSAKKRFESSLFDIRQLVQADLFDSELGAARELNDKGFARAAGAIAGVVLEAHLLQICENHNIKITKQRPTINDLAQKLQSKDVIELPEMKKIMVLADTRNKCGHKKEADPDQEEIKDFITDVDKTTRKIS